MNQKVSSGSGVVVEVENKKTMDLDRVDGGTQKVISLVSVGSVGEKVLSESQDVVMSQRVGNTIMMKKLFGLK